METNVVVLLRFTLMMQHALLLLRFDSYRRAGEWATFYATSERKGPDK